MTTATIETETPTPETTAGTPAWTVDAKQLIDALKYVKGALAKKSTLPVLSNALLSSDGLRLRVMATNLETSIETWIPATIETEGAITLPHALLTGGILPRDRVTITVEGAKATLTQGRVTTDLKGISAEEYPIVPPFEGDPIAIIDGAALTEAIVKSAFAAYADKDIERPILESVCLKIEDTCATFVAADGFRLALKRTCGIVGDGEHTLLIPRTAAMLIAKAGFTGDVAIHLGATNKYIVNKHVVFVGNTGRITTRLIEGNYVDIKRVIPVDWATRLIANRKELIEAYNLTSQYAKEAANITRLAVLPMPAGKSLLKVSADAAEVGKRTITVDCDAEGCDAEIALNYTFVLDALKSMDTEAVVIELTKSGPAKLMPFSPTGGEEGDEVHVIMPCYNGRG